jgi:hypothetical protein
LNIRVFESRDERGILFCGMTVGSAK